MTEIEFYNPCFEKPTKGVYNPPLNRDFIALDVKNIDDKTMLKIMGKEGKVFKAISHQTGVDYIFWLKNEGLIAIWGYSDSLPYAIQRLQNRIYLIIYSYNPNNLTSQTQQTNDSFDTPFTFQNCSSSKNPKILSTMAYDINFPIYQNKV
jgi:hypothetical protein